MLGSVERLGIVVGHKRLAVDLPIDVATRARSLEVIVPTAFDTRVLAGFSVGSMLVHPGDGGGGVAPAAKDKDVAGGSVGHALRKRFSVAPELDLDVAGGIVGPNV